jgi:hypothetical protein
LKKKEEVKATGKNNGKMHKLDNKSGRTYGYFGQNVQRQGNTTQINSHPVSSKPLA